MRRARRVGDFIAVLATTAVDEAGEVVQVSAFVDPRLLIEIDVDAIVQR